MSTFYASEGLCSCVPKLSKYRPELQIYNQSSSAPKGNQKTESSRTRSKAPIGSIFNHSGAFFSHRTVYIVDIQEHMSASSLA